MIKAAVTVVLLTGVWFFSGYFAVAQDQNCRPQIDNCRPSQAGPEHQAPLAEPGPGPLPSQVPSPPRSNNQMSLQKNIQCCVRHWISKQNGRVAPEGGSTSDFKSRSDLLLTCQMGIPRNAWAGYLSTLGAKDFCSL